MTYFLELLGHLEFQGDGPRHTTFERFGVGNLFQHDMYSLRFDG